MSSSQLHQQTAYSCSKHGVILISIACILTAAGEPTTDITEVDGKRIIKRTGMYTGTELHLTR